MKDLNQLLLKFDLKQNYKNEDFYVNKSNFFAFSIIEKWPKWEKNILNIYGENIVAKLTYQIYLTNNIKLLKCKQMNLIMKV